MDAERLDNDQDMTPQRVNAGTPWCSVSIAAASITVFPDDEYSGVPHMIGIPVDSQKLPIRLYLWLSQPGTRSFLLPADPDPVALIVAMSHSNTHFANVMSDTKRVKVGMTLWTTRSIPGASVDLPGAHHPQGESQGWTRVRVDDLLHYRTLCRRRRYSTYLTGNTGPVIDRVAAAEALPAADGQIVAVP